METRIHRSRHSRFVETATKKAIYLFRGSKRIGNGCPVIDRQDSRIGAPRQHRFAPFAFAEKFSRRALQLIDSPPGFFEKGAAAAVQVVYNPLHLFL